MNDDQQVEILLVEDNPNDAELTMRSLRKGNFLNKLYWVKDGGPVTRIHSVAGRLPNTGRQ